MRKYHHFTGKDVTVVICAYKECPYLEESIKAIISQTVKPNILISTSTPNNYIQNFAEKYGIEMKVNLDGGQIKDYNFAMGLCKTALGMLAHQDDLLDKRYIERCLEELNKARKPIMACTNYLEMHNDVIDSKPSTMVRIKRILILPIRNTWLRGTIFGKRLCMRVGNPITHPSVICVMKEMPEVCFKEQYKAAMDWELWERLSRQKGDFVYVKDILLYHRMNDDNQTAKLLKTTNARYDDEYAIFCRLWPKPIAKFLTLFYSKAGNYY
ncbi:MAG: glycosyltransferase [Bacteroidales bacterium]|nr:glycosyltransferase [Clostridium sp.]MCM1202912.1 glycosyltransferase [Bacteroidales bacterium]